MIKQRLYRGYESPLAYFQAHPEKYAELSRGQLGDVDQALYASLHNWGQMYEAIPNSLRLSQQQIEELVDLHPKYDGNPNEASKHEQRSRTESSGCSRQ